MGQTEENETSTSVAEVQQQTGPTLDEIEGMLTKYSLPIAKSRGVQPSQYRIVLAMTMKNKTDLMYLTPGPVVKIVLNWPEIAGNGAMLKTLLTDALSLIKRHKLNNRWLPQTYANALADKEERRKWYRLNFGDEGEILADLLPKSRTRAVVTRGRTVTMTDPFTKLSVAVVDEHDVREEKDMIFEARMKLSRLVRRFEEARNGPANVGGSNESVRRNKADAETVSQTESLVSVQDTGGERGETGITPTSHSVALVRSIDGPAQFTFNIGG